MMTGETEQKLSLLARRVWVGSRTDKTLQEQLLRDPASFLQENGIAIPDNFETGVSLSADSVSFRFRPRNAVVDAEGAEGSAPILNDGSIFFRFEFQWIWD
jgi:hypothetical protein